LFHFPGNVVTFVVILMTVSDSKYVDLLTADVADSYIKISACLTQLATADSSNLDKYVYFAFRT